LLMNKKTKFAAKSVKMRQRNETREEEKVGRREREIRSTVHR